MSNNKSTNGDQPTAPPWPLLPDNITVHDDVDLTAPDPCYVPEIVNAGNDRTSHRRCVAKKRDGGRCATRAMHSSLVCPLHGGRMSPQQGHRARKTQAAERQARAERALQLQKLGTRAVVAQALADEAEKVDRTVRHLLSAAAEGDLASAKALTAYFDQALGRPTERHEHRTPTGLEDLESMPHEELERLVAHGRAQRLGLRAAPEPGVGELDGAGDDVADVGQLLPRVP